MVEYVFNRVGFMPSSRKSKVVKVGSSHMVVLPVDWVRYNEIEKGDIENVTYDGKIEIEPPQRENPTNTRQKR